ncbi:MAG: hypothetical protein JWR85_2495 [Marmoricola sp.]|nr:hypothetical protein [Marmoricola sp.]
MSLTGLVAGCGMDKEATLRIPDSSATSDPSPTSAGPSFSLPSPGDEIGVQLTAPPAGEESSKGAALFAAWALSVLLHTPREAAATNLWSQASGAGCEPCPGAASAWTEQLAAGKVFRYAGAPHFLRTVVRAQPQGENWFVQFEAAVPRSTLEQKGRVLESADAEQLGYTFKLNWADAGWRIVDFHVLG